MHRIWVLATLMMLGVLAWSTPAFGQEGAQKELKAMKAELGAPPRPTARTEEAIAEYRTAFETWQARRQEMYSAFIEKHEGTDAARELLLEQAMDKMRSSNGAPEVMQETISELAEIGEAAQDKMLKARAAYFRASAHDQIEEWDKAIVAYEKAAAISPDEELAKYAKKGAYAATIQRDGLLDIGKKPIAFELPGIDGKPISPAMYTGKVVLIDFWATWCGPCIRELPVVKETYAKYHDKGFEIIGISLDSDRSKLDAFLEREKLPWVQFYDGKGWQNEVAELYGINSIPATFLLNQKGEIFKTDLRGPDLMREVAGLLGEEFEADGDQEAEPELGKRPVVGDMLPAFEAQTTGGDAVSPNSLKGKVVLVDFWATWCGPCVAELPHVKKAYADFADEGFTVLGISLDKPRQISLEKLNSFVEQRELGWPMVYETGMEIAMQYGISSIPSTFLVDRTGKIRATDLRGEQLIEKVAELIAEQ